MPASISPLITFFLIICCRCYAFKPSLLGFQKNFVRGVLPLETISILLSAEEQTNPYLIELAKAVGQLTLPVAASIYISNVIEKQISSVKESTEKQIAVVEKQIVSTAASTEKQIAAVKESTEKQIAAVEKQIVINKELNEKSIMASEARIESILLKFTQSIDRKEK
jgi:hypothetical protein